MNSKLLIASLALSFITGCGGSGGNSNNPSPQNKEQNPAPEAPAPEISIVVDSETPRSVQVSELKNKNRKTFLVLNDQISVDKTGNELYFEHGELLKADRGALAIGFICKLVIRNGKALSKGEKIPFTYKDSSGGGTGGNGSNDFYLSTIFDIESPSLNHFSCFYHGDDMLFSVKLEDLDKTFGDWFSVVLAK